MNIPKINEPLSGSRANAWTEVKTPERTRKVPNKLAAKDKIDSNKDQFLNTDPFIKLNIDGHEFTATDFGVGPVDASLNAIQKITTQITDEVRL